MILPGVCKALNINAPWSSGHGEAMDDQSLFQCLSAHICPNAMGDNGHGAELYYDSSPDPSSTAWY